MTPSTPRRYYLQEQCNVPSGRVTYQIVDSVSGRVIRRERVWGTAHKLLAGLNEDAAREAPAAAAAGGTL